MLLIDNETVDRVLTIEDAINAQDESFRRLDTGEAIHRPRIDVYVPTGRSDDYYRWGTMEGADQQRGVFAIRMKSDVMTWPKDEQGGWTQDKYCVTPGTYCGLVFLFSTVNGEPLAIINDGVIQHMRVGAGAGLGAKYLSRPDSRVVGMIGSGGMARTYLQAFRAVRPIEVVRVYSPSKENREAYAREMSSTLGISVEPVDSAEGAVAGADIVATCTDALEHVLEGKYLEPGVHVTNVQGHELDDEVFNRASVTVRQGVGGLRVEQDLGAGRGHGRNAFVGGTPEQVAGLPPELVGGGTQMGGGGTYPSFTDLATGRVQGRVTDDDITLYLNGGNQGLQFAAVGAVVLEKARKADLGRELPTEWFLQNIRD
jgi:alanine dehydrogenase